MMIDLNVDYCSREAAEFAVRRWHYSKCLPASSLVTIGVWENNKYIGCVIFSKGACPYMHMGFKIKYNEIVELTRVALNNHKTPVTKIISISIKMLKKLCPDLRLIVSFADMNQRHLGIIYQAGNWIYVGIGKSRDEFFYKGRWRHFRLAASVRKKSKKMFDSLQKRKLLDKYKYVMPLDKKMRIQIMPLSKPYPKNEERKVPENE